MTYVKEGFTIVHNVAHEAQAARLSRQRRRALHGPFASAHGVLDSWRQRQRIARTARMSPEEFERNFGSVYSYE